MEKFMLIFQGGVKSDASPTEMQENMDKWMAWVEKLTRDGKYVSGEPLIPGGKIVTGPSTVTDGPYTEGKEIIGGYFIINSASIDEAVAECAHFPDFDRGGKVEVRQVMKVEF